MLHIDFVETLCNALIHPKLKVHLIFTLVSCAGDDFLIGFVSFLSLKHLSNNGSVYRSHCLNVFNLD